MSIPEIKGNILTDSKEISGKVLGVRGPRGYSTYQIAVMNGFDGTEEEWLETLKGESLLKRITPLAGEDLTENAIDAIGIPVYVADISEYENYGITETGWYIFARITAKAGVTVTAATAVEGAAGVISTVGENHIDIAVRFETASYAQKVIIDWGSCTETFVFRANDLAIRNLDYRVTFYVYDADPFAKWDYTFAADAAFVSGKNYFVREGEAYSKAEVTAGDPVPAYYTLSDETYTQVSGTFEAGVEYYTKSGTGYTAAEVTVGDPIPAYFVHTRVTIEGLTKNITYRLNETVDCPMTFVLPEIDDETHGAWYEIRCRHAGAYSMTLVPPSSDVKVATEHTQAETAGLNMINLHYTVVDGAKVWRFMNTHSTIPA